jgi:hypothetical protein
MYVIHKASDHLLADIIQANKITAQLQIEYISLIESLDRIRI